MIAYPSSVAQDWALYNRLSVIFFWVMTIGYGLLVSGPFFYIVYRFEQLVKGLESNNSPIPDWLTMLYISHKPKTYSIVEEPPKHYERAVAIYSLWFVLRFTEHCYRSGIRTSTSSSFDICLVRNVQYRVQLWRDLVFRSSDFSCHSNVATRKMIKILFIGYQRIQFK